MAKMIVGLVVPLITFCAGVAIFQTHIVAGIALCALACVFQLTANKLITGVF